MSYRKLRLSAAGYMAAMLLGVAASCSAQLRVGAAKVDLTPTASDLFEPYTSIHDHIFTRAIVLENGNQRALLMNVDVGNFQPGFVDPLLDTISSKFGISRDNMVVSAVHVHSSMPSVGGGLPGSKEPTPKAKLFIDRLTRSMLEAVQQAQQALEPAEVGFGEGKLDLNVNRDAIDPKTRLWAQEPNREFPSDKTFAVVEFRRPNGGQPIAVYMNYAMHAVTMFLRGDLSADFPGVASQYLEDVFDGKTVAVWTQGAEGDQNPLSMRPILAINEARIHHEMSNAAPKDDPTEYNAALMRLFFGGAKETGLPLDPKLATESWDVVEGIGVLSAEEALRVMEQIPHFSANPEIQGATAVVTCPGRKRLDNAREGVAGRYEDGPLATVQIGALRIGDIALGHVNGEPYNKIGVEAKQGSPLRQTLVVALTAGGPNGGYMPSDDAFGHLTFQVLGSKFKPGCAETGIVNGIDKIVEQEVNHDAESRQKQTGSTNQSRR